MRLNGKVALLIGLSIPMTALGGIALDCYNVRAGSVTSGGVTTTTPGYVYCEFVDNGLNDQDAPVGEGSSGGGGGIEDAVYEWIDWPSPTLKCGAYSGMAERLAAMSAMYKSQLAIRNGALPSAMLQDDVKTMNHHWMAWFSNADGTVLRGAIYEHNAPYYAEINFKETVAPGC